MYKVFIVKFHWFSHLFVETLVEKAQYEEAAEKSIQLETKVCNGYCTLIMIPTAIIISFYDSNAWQWHTMRWRGNKDEKNDNQRILSGFTVTTNFQNRNKETNAKLWIGSILQCSSILGQKTVSKTVRELCLLPCCFLHF